MNMTPHTLMATIARIWAAAESNLDSAGLVSFASAGTSGVRPARRMKPSAAHTMGATNATAAGTTSFQNSVIPAVPDDGARDGRDGGHAQCGGSAEKPQQTLIPTPTMGGPHLIVRNHIVPAFHKVRRVRMPSQLWHSKSQSDNMLSSDRMTGIGYPSMPQGAVDAYPIDRCFYMRADMCRSFASAYAFLHHDLKLIYEKL